MPNQPIIQIHRLNPEQDADIPLPRYMTPLSAGMDICAAVTETVTVKPGTIELISTGFALALPEGFEAQIRPRSGLAVRHGIGLINSPGTIDADYRGEVKLAVINLGPKSHPIVRGDRIAQMIITRVFQARFQEVDHLDVTRRGKGGFGHTGR
ncbi:MAG: dUTP diphosphatase [Thermodesulfobacteriota bacterium]|nr:dUTP diphosphatase [Thermodesulfobacteriota bacterium]